MKALFLGFFVFGLAACEDIKAPRIFSGNEVPPELLNAPRAVQVPSPETLADPSWPRLGDVPSKPKNFSPQPLIQQTTTEMQNERTKAEVLRQQADMPPPKTQE